jgi:deferrochelatase/peroxidase EfeB
MTPGEPQHPPSRPPRGLSRRDLLRWGAVGGVAAGANLLCQPGAAAAPIAVGLGQGTDGPSGPDGASERSLLSAQRASFDGDYQLVVLSEPAPATTVVAFDVTVSSRSELRSLLQELTARLRALYAGGSPAFDGPGAPPGDSGILGPAVPANSVGFIFGIGASLFDQRFGLAASRPPGLLPMEPFPNDDLDPAQTEGDFCLQICADQPDVVMHALRDITRHTRGAMQARWRLDAFKSPPRPSGTPRNLMGFKDGTANPTTSSSTQMADLVWVQGSSGAPQWAVGGTYMVVRVIKIFVEAWDRLLLGDQERVIGRRKGTGSPLGANGEFAAFDYSADSSGAVTPLTAHIRLANPRTLPSEPSRILRRSYNYDRGLDSNGDLDQGLLFTCFQQDLLKQFITVQARLINEPMAQFISPVGGGYFFCPPGLGGRTASYFANGLV